MNWRNVLYLVRVERKSGRLLRGVKTTRYRESGVAAYWPYWTAAIVGILVGLLINWGANAFYSSSAAKGLPPLSTAALSFLVSLPTLIVILSVILTMLQQIQLAGVKKATQVMYRLPITWQEQTLASILANLFGIPISVVIACATGAIAFGAFNGLIVPALLTTLGMLAAAFIASSLTEIIRVVQVRFTGAVYKSSGKAAVWVRFIGSLMFFLVFYIVYLSITQGSLAFIQGLAQAQNSVWFVPFVWPGVALFYLVNGIFLEGAIFAVVTALFVAGVYFAAIELNKRFGLYEPPAITVQTRGTVYTPKTGILGRLGIANVEAALIRKDIRAFTRRRELISIFIVPIVFIILPVIQSINLSNTGVPGEINLMFLAMVFLFPAALMAMSLGNMLIGEEGPAVWRIYASPISPTNLVRSKLFFQTSLALITLIATGTFGAIFYKSSPIITAVGFLEGLFLVLALGGIALAIGFKGADFTIAIRPRMIQQRWSLISFGVCAVAGLAVLAPLAPHVLTLLASGFTSTAQINELYLAVSVVASGIIAAVIAAVLYRVNVKSAAELIRKAEV